ncbi:zinc-binding dehydrogenase [Streptomyces bugieae]|uniref:zinc-binding dehydrogenase n=1 Tax=Streptomyces bugieae TaxID=3098223 RepID=UPI003B00C444
MRWLQPVRAARPAPGQAQGAVVRDRGRDGHGRRGRLPGDQAPRRAVAAGKLDVPVRHAYPLAEAARAHADIETRRNKGKTVLLP